MNASDVREALYKRWPASEYLCVHEAPQDSMRQGRKIDVLVVSLWKSRGHALDAVEIKVSMGDWKKELENAAKADWWWEHTHRFWVAVPLSMAPAVRDQLPETWGLIACDEGGTKVVVQAPHHQPTALPWTACIGIMRAASGAGANALQRAESNGRSQGYKEGRERGLQEAGTGAFQALKEAVAQAEEATGIPIAQWSHPERESWGFRSREEILAAVTAVLTDETAVKRARQSLGYAHDQVARVHKDLAQILEEPEANESERA